MHPNPAFRQEPQDRNLGFARARGFGILAVNGPDGPLMAHVPFLLSPDGTLAELHLARSTPTARAGLPAFSVSGPDACISPDWSGPADLVPDQVPTRNHVAVHLRRLLAATGPEPPRQDVAQRDGPHDAHDPALSPAHQRSAGHMKAEPEQAVPKSAPALTHAPPPPEPGRTGPDR